MWQHPRIYTRYEGNKSAVYYRLELKGLMDHTAYLILKGCGPREDPCRVSQLSAAALRPAEERHADREEEEAEESRRICGFRCCHGNRV